MSRRTRALLLSTVALVALCGLMVAMLVLFPEVSTDDTSTGSSSVGTTTTIPLKPTTGEAATKPTGFENNKTSIYSAVITTPEEEFTLQPNENGYLRVKGHEDLESYANSVSYSYIIEALTDITALAVANSDPENPEAFGFGGEKITSTAAKVTYTDGSTISFEIGDETPDRSGFYLRRDGDKAIYVVDADFASSVMQSSMEYLMMIPVAAPATTQTNSEDTAVVRDVTLSGSIRPSTIRFQVSDTLTGEDQNSQIMTGYFLTEPYYRNVKSGTNLLSVSTYSGFTASDIAMLRPTEADFATFGLDNPYSVCTVNLSIQKSTKETDKDGHEITKFTFYNTFEYTIKLGNTLKDDESMRYALVYHGDELVPMVFEVVTDSLLWAETQYDDVADELLFFTYINEVDSLTLTLDGKTHEFKLTHYPNKDSADEKLKVVSNGNRYNTAAFRNVYQSIMGILRMESTTEKPKGEPVLTLDIKVATETSRDGWVKLYRYSAGKYIAEHDSGEIYMVAAKDVEDTLSICREFLGN